MPDDDYGPFQQPDDGYLTQGQQPGAAGYGQQQSPASAYAAGGPGGGVGSGAQPTKTYNLPGPETVWSSNLARYPRVSTLPLYVNDKAPPSTIRSSSNLLPTATWPRHWQRWQTQLLVATGSPT